MPVRLIVYIDGRELWKGTYGKARDGKCIEGGVEGKLMEIPWVTGQDDSPCRQKKDLKEDKRSIQSYGLRLVTNAEA